MQIVDRIKEIIKNGFVQSNIFVFYIYSLIFFQTHQWDTIYIFLDLIFPNTEPKRFEVYINGKKIGFSTALRSETRQIDNYLRPGTNSVEIKPLTDLTITEIRIRLANS